ncbi:translational machinery protein [uncultured Reyranella sp.]|uniref:translational machinery protein n=1 Tax=uncultured Reyranella sp. TaxID=735512 RepID=UPI00259C87BD|nr:translational machinery protein [uncultured Reyranella sp.]
MDSKEAHIFRFNAVDAEGEVLKAHNPFRKVHHKAGAIGSGHAAIERDFLDRIVDAVRGTTSWLLVGPGQAKQALVRHLEEHLPHDLKRLAGIEAMDHPTDGELLAHARRAFKAIDRMGGPVGEGARAPH